MFSTLVLAGVGIVSTIHLHGTAQEAGKVSMADRFEKDVRPLLQKHCFKCHDAKTQEGEIDLEPFTKLADIRKSLRTWQKVLDMLESAQMPPKNAPQPTPDERAVLRNWTRAFLTEEARAKAGDPGPVVLRRLSNAEYTYTLRDLTGLAKLDPAKEFPTDGAAGEGFTNTGNALVMSPALFPKYLDAAKAVAAHAVVLPDGIRFSPHTTRPDWSEEILTKIRDFYNQFTDPRGGDKVNLQGIVFATNEGGRLPIEKYLAATVIEREALLKKMKTLDAVAAERKLSPKYLGILWKALTDEPSASIHLNRLRVQWRAAKAEQIPALTQQVANLQKILWKFTTVGHIGKVGGPKAWLEPVEPIVDRHEIKMKLPPPNASGEVVLSLVASDAGASEETASVVWQRPRLVAPGRPDLLLRDVAGIVSELAERRKQVFSKTAKYLEAADEMADSQGKLTIPPLAAKHALEESVLAAWLDYLGIGATGPTVVKNHLKTKLPPNKAYEFIKGWGVDATPVVVANSSKQHVRVPGNMFPGNVAVHPSPTLQIAVGWQAPVTDTFRIAGLVTHAHPECGNGVTWALELRRGGVRQRLAAGTAQGSKGVAFGPLENIAIQKGDLVSLFVGPRDGNHSCDLTAVELKLVGTASNKSWDLSKELSPDILAANPHADGFGNAEVWHLYTEPDTGKSDGGSVIPANSILARWRTTNDKAEKQKLAEAFQALLTLSSKAVPDVKSVDGQLYQQITSWNGPLFRGSLTPRKDSGKSTKLDSKTLAWGLSPSLFGSATKEIDEASIRVNAPSVLEVRLPGDLVAGCELVTTGVLDAKSNAKGGVQFGVVPGKVVDASLAVAGSPIVANPGSEARKRLQASFEQIRSLFPAALCYTKIVPVDEVVTLTLYYREDDQLARLMLTAEQKATLDRLWDELHFVSGDALKMVDAYIQLMEYATQDSNPKMFEPMRKPIMAAADSYRKRLIDTEPKHLEAVLKFADQAYRRPITKAESESLRKLYAKLRDEKISHEEAIRLTLSRILVSPAFLYRADRPSTEVGQGPVSNHELATRLSYFLWSSAPDAELRHLADAGKLTDPAVLKAQTQRMLKDAKVRRLATEFACQWLHIYDFDPLEEKTERFFPTFIAMRKPIYEESIQFFTDFFQNDRSVLEILGADYTFLNEDLAKHYGIPGVKGPDWRKVDGVTPYARGGVLAQASTLAKQSGASRTSPILRGNWISEVLLGEKLPRPPKGVPPLPAEETESKELNVRQLVERHSSDPKCAICHAKIDPFGFSLEGFDAIGRRRDKDLAGRPIDTKVKTPDGAEFEGLEGLRKYLLTQRRDVFVRQFCKKLLGYSLGRAVQLSDEPLLESMQANLKSNGYRIRGMVELIVESRQFREIRGRQVATEE